MEVCFLLFSSYIVPVFCSRSVIMQKRNAIFCRALAGLSPEFRKFSTCSGVFRKFGVCLTFRALGLTLRPCRRNGLRTLRVLCLFAGAVPFCEGCALARLSRINAEKRPAPVMKPVFCFPIGYRRRPSSLMMFLYLSMSTLWR